MKRIGDKESPCLTPLWEAKNSEYLFLYFMQSLTDLYISTGPTSLASLNNVHVVLSV